MIAQVGRYNITGQLGKGAMGVVYLADDPSLRRQVAIKTIELATDDENQRAFLRNRLMRDAQAAAVLAHPNIVAVYDVIEDDHAAYVVMEYVAGESLAARLRRTPSPETAFTLRVLREVASALDYTHSRGVIHRDVKPGNIMIDSTGAAKIMDFGIARIVDSQTNTPTGMVMGTIQYMAPEQIKGEPVNGRADQFALAAVAYEMMTGALMFGAQSMATLAYKIVNEAPAPIRSLNATLPAGIDSVFARALAKNPAERFANCSDYVAALDAAFAGAPAVYAAQARTETIALPLVAPAPKARRSWWLAVAVAAAAVVATAGIGALIWKPWAVPAASIPSAPTAAVATPSATPLAVTPVPPAPSKSTHAPKPPVAESEHEDLPAVTDTPANEPPAPRPAAEALNQAREQIGKGEYAAAIPLLDKALTIRPAWVLPHLSRGIARFHLDDFEGAAADLTVYLDRNPKYAQGYLYRGNSYARLKQDGRALADYNLGIESNPSLPQLWVARGNALLRGGESRRAVNDLTEAIRLAPDKPFAYSARAKAREAAGDRAGAREDRRRAQELGAK